MQYFKGAKVKIRSMNVTGTVKKARSDGRYDVRVRRVLMGRDGQPLKSWRGRDQFTVETHVAHGDDLELSRAYKDGTANSEKGLKTLEMMGVDPETVTMVFIKQVKELHDVTGNWRCDTCSGCGYMRVPKKLAEEAGVPINDTIRNYNYDVYDLDGYDLGKVNYAGEYTWDNTVYVRCASECQKMKRVRGFAAHAEVYAHHETREIEVTVGYPQWTQGVKMDSRFRHGKSVHVQCQLCAKAIPSGNLCPVEGRDSDLQPHGLYIGLDCAKKFTGYNVEFEPLAGTTDIIIDMSILGGTK
jgi:hypothetical protein